MVVASRIIKRVPQSSSGVHLCDKERTVAARASSEQLQNVGCLHWRRILASSCSLTEQSVGLVRGAITCLTATDTFPNNPLWTKLVTPCDHFSFTITRPGHFIWISSSPIL